MLSKPLSQGLKSDAYHSTEPLREEIDFQEFPRGP